jgi:hypothetical protein
MNYGRLPNLRFKRRNPQPKSNNDPFGRRLKNSPPLLDDVDSTEVVDFVAFPVSMFGTDSTSPVAKRSTTEYHVGGGESPTAVHDYIPSMEQFDEVFGPPFSKQAPEEILTTYVEATTSPATMVHVIPLDDDENESAPPSAAENFYSPPVSKFQQETPDRWYRDSDDDVQAIPAAPQKEQRTSAELQYRQEMQDWDLAALLAMKEDYPSPERPVLRTPLLPKSLIDIEVDATEGVASWRELFENVASEMTLCTSNMAAECAVVPEIDEPNNVVGEETSTTGSVPAEKRARLGATPPQQSRNTILRAESYWSTETAQSFGFQHPPPLKRAGVQGQGINSQKGCFPFPDCQGVEDVEEDIETDILFHRHDSKRADDVIVPIVVSGDYVNRHSLPDEQSSTTTRILQLPESTHRVRLSLLIDEYELCNYAQILKELVGNDQISELDIRRARSKILRHRTIHDLLSLFSVLETLPCMERLYLQDFESNELELIPFEELLESNHAHLSSLEIRTSEEPGIDSVLGRQGYVI